MQKGLRVLLVEDEAIIAMLLQETVEHIGHIVCAIAATEADAVKQALLCQPDLIIVDSGLSEGSGVAAIDRILLTRFVPHIFVTGNAKSVRLDHPDAIILEKPFFVPGLVIAIDKAVAVRADR